MHHDTYVFPKYLSKAHVQKTWYYHGTMSKKTSSVQEPSNPNYCDITFVYHNMVFYMVLQGFSMNTMLLCPENLVLKCSHIKKI